MTDKRQSALRKSLPVMPSVWLLSLCCFCSEVSSGTSFSYVSSSSEDHKLFFYCVDSHSPPRSTLIMTKLSSYDSERDFDAAIIRGPLRVFTVHCASLKTEPRCPSSWKCRFNPSSLSDWSAVRGLFRWEPGPWHVGLQRQQTRASQHSDMMDIGTCRNVSVHLLKVFTAGSG